MAGMLFNGKTSSWSYTIPAGSGAKDFAVTITGCSGGDAGSYYTSSGGSPSSGHVWENGEFDFYYTQGKTGASVYITADNLSLTIAGGQGNKGGEFARSGSYTNKYHHDRIGGHWEKEAYQDTEAYTDTERYWIYKTWWDRVTHHKVWRNRQVTRYRTVTKYRDVYKDDYLDWTERIWHWQSIQNQVKPTQAGQSRSFLCSARNKISFSSSQQFNLCVWEL